MGIEATPCACYRFDVPLARQNARLRFHCFLPALDTCKLIAKNSCPCMKDWKRWSERKDRRTEQLSGNQAHRAALAFLQYSHRFVIFRRRSSAAKGRGLVREKIGQRSASLLGRIYGGSAE